MTRWLPSACAAALILATGAARAGDHGGSGSSEGAPYGPPIADQTRFSHVVIDQAEGRFEDGGSAFHWNGEAWAGTDRDRLWVKSEGEAEGGRVRNSRLEILYARPISPYWNVQAGVRGDFGEGPGRTWAALGVEGLAPYWVRTTATAYIGAEGRVGVRLEAADDLRLTQKVILEPRVEALFAARPDTARGLGGGLVSTDVGLRLRYEVSPKFAPYVGVNWSGKFGRTADFARAAGQPASATSVAVGIRAWF